MSKLKSILPAIAGLASTVWLPYQLAWINDESEVAIWEKARRVGADYCESFRCVRERINGERVLDYWYSSADESAAYEFAEYVRAWLQLYDKVSEEVTTNGIDDGREWLKMTFTLPKINGRRPRITVMTSNPKRFRSKGGDVTLSELAFHQDADEMWKAAAPTATWGGRIRILSTHNGHGTKFNALISQARKHEDPELYGTPRPTDLKASVHRTDIYNAVSDGLVEQINRATGRELTRDEFIAEMRSLCSTQEIWEEEFECNPSKEGGSYFPHALLRPCVSDRAAKPTEDLDTFIADIKLRSAGCTKLSAGSDIGRRKDRFVIWVWGRNGTKRITLGVLVLHNKPFDVMEHAINTLMNTTFNGKRITRISIDETGLGMQLAERMVKKHRSRAEAVSMTNAVKEDMFTRLRAGVEEITVELPDDDDTCRDFGSIRKEVTVAGNIRYSAASNEHGHADRATAAALGLVADESAKAVMKSYSVAGEGL
ncbi:MAG: hypothetical protein JJ916_10425 [Phycisphaerales bacterium]|nr:hypothetical protein [Phycisphaerales bacterium]